MSSKTTFKRIALIAVAGLSLGVLSVAPSSAVQQMDSLILSSATAAQQTTETATATSAVATLSFLGSAGTDTMTVTASLVSGPAGNTALPSLSVIRCFVPPICHYRGNNTTYIVSQWASFYGPSRQRYPRRYK